jgi:hypothetical protein
MKHGHVKIGAIAEVAEVLAAIAVVVVAETPVAAVATERRVGRARVINSIRF